MFTKIIKALLHRLIRRFESRYNYDMAYGHQLVRQSPSAFLRFSLTQAMGSYQGNAPLNARFTAKITATQYEDCGPCCQLVVNMAAEAGMPANQLEALIKSNTNAMQPEVELVHSFTQATLEHNPLANDLRQRIIQLWGEAGLIDISMAITSARAYPTIKYALVHGKTCSKVQIGAQPNNNQAALLNEQ